MPLIRPAIAILGCLIAGRSPFAQAPAHPASFAVAVHEHETLLPIARYEDGRWLNTWPGPDEDSKPVPALQDIPIAWLGRPVPSEWRLWPLAGGSEAVRVTGTNRSGGCVVSPKLAVGAPRFPPDESFDQVHAGLVTTDGAPVDGIDMLVGRWRTTRAPAAADILEASKRPTAASLERVTVRGWLVLEGSAAPMALGIDAYVGRDDETLAPDSLANVSSRIPLGVISAGGRAYWFVEVPTGESGSFEIHRVGPHGVERILEIDAGGC